MLSAGGTNDVSVRGEDIGRVEGKVRYGIPGSGGVEDVADEPVARSVARNKRKPGPRVDGVMNVLPPKKVRAYAQAEILLPCS